MKIAQKSIKFLTIVAIALFSISGYAVDSDKNQEHFIEVNSEKINWTGPYLIKQ